MLKPCEENVVPDQQQETEEVQEKKSTQITFYGQIASIKLLNPSSCKKYDSGKEVYHVSVEFTRNIDKDKIDVGQSVAVFP